MYFAWTIKKRLNEAWENEKSNYASTAKHSGWRIIREEICKAVYPPDQEEGAVELVRQ